MENKVMKKRGGQQGHKGGTGRPPKPDPRLRNNRRIIILVNDYQYETALSKTPSGSVNEYARSVFLQNM